MRRWIGTVPGRTRLAASQTPTIPLNLKRTGNYPWASSPQEILMDRTRSYLALLCTLLMLAPSAGLAADQPGPGTGPPDQNNHPPPVSTGSHGFLGSITGPYRPKLPSSVNLSNSTRLESLLRGGNLYLSLQDALALALENNIDLEIQRYVLQVAENSLFAARPGGFASPVPPPVFAPPSSVTGPASSAGLQTYV